MKVLLRSVVGSKWFEPEEAKRKINQAQAAFVDRLCQVVSSDG